MNAAALSDTLLLGAVTGMRSMAGPAVLASRHGGALKGLVAALAAGEMVADKTPVVGNRTDPAPLAGRALMGALVGGVIARQSRSNPLTGALLGASAAVAMTHLAFQIRKRLPLPNVLGGALEDAIVIGLSSRYLNR
jgi:uncharacterized membrane protein